MDIVLIFSVRVVIRMLDPLTLIFAVAFGALASKLASTAARIAVVIAGTAIITAGTAVLAWHSQSLEGAPFRFHWAPYTTAAALQILLAFGFLLAVRRRRTASSTTSGAGRTGAPL